MRTGIKKAIAAGRMQPAGMNAYEARTAERSVVYAYEREHAEFDVASKKRFQADRAAWKFFQAQPPSYRRVSTWWVISAKKEETRERRFAQLLADSAAGRTIASRSSSSFIAATGSRFAASISARRGWRSQCRKKSDRRLTTTRPVRVAARTVSMNASREARMAGCSA